MKIEQVDIVYRYDTDAEPISFRLEKEKTYFFYFDDEIGKWWCRKEPIGTERIEK